jgi:sugar phosphate isomerase/epimerase
MEIKFFCPRWGSERLGWEEFMNEVKRAGFDGLEWAIPNDKDVAEIDAVFALAEKFELSVIAQHYETNNGDFTQHYIEYVNWFDKIKNYSVDKINSQTGKDYFSFEQNRQLLHLAGVHGAMYHVPVVHEMHRGKFSFASHITRDFLEQLPNLRLTFDISHWVNVAESYLDDQKEAVLMAIMRADHIHARVGYPEGPQVPDPRVPVWQEALQKHLFWWDTIVNFKKELNLPLTITPEFGPFPYMIHHPLTDQPIASQWDINVWMMNFLRKRYS